MMRTDDELYDEVPKGFCTCESARNCETATDASRLCMKCIARGDKCKHMDAELSEKYCLEQHMDLGNNNTARFMEDLTQKTRECNSHTHDDAWLFSMECLKKSWDDYLSRMTLLQKILFPSDKEGAKPDDAQ